MGRWKKLRALEAAARTGDAMARAEIARAAREQATTQSVLNAIQSLTKTGAGAALQGYDVLTSGMAEQALAGGPGIEDVEAPDFTQDPLGAMSSFIQNLPRGTAREKASLMAAERAPQAFAQKLPLVAQKIEEDRNLDPARVAYDVLSKDPVISSLPEQRREAMSAQAAQQVQDDLLRRQRDQETYEIDRALKFQKLQPKAEKPDAEQIADIIATNLDPRAVELRDQLSAVDDPEAYENSYQVIKSQVESLLPDDVEADSSLGMSITSKALEKLLSGVRKKPMDQGHVIKFVAEASMYEELAELDELRKDANFSPDIGRVLENLIADELKTPLVNVGDVAKLVKRLENKVELTPAQENYVAKALEIRFHVAQAKVDGIPSDKDMNNVLEFALTPWETDEVWNRRFGQTLSDISKRFEMKVNAFNSVRMVPKDIIQAKNRVSSYAEKFLQEQEDGPQYRKPSGEMEDVEEAVAESVSRAAGIVGGAARKVIGGALDGINGKPEEKAKNQMIIVELKGEKRMFTPEKLEQFEKTFGVKLKRLGTVDEPAPAAPAAEPAPAAPAAVPEAGAQTPAATTPGGEDSSTEIGPNAPNYGKAVEALNLIRSGGFTVKDAEPGGKKYDDPFPGLQLNPIVERAVAQNIFNYNTEQIIEILQQLLNKTIKDEEAIYLMTEAANE